MKNYYEVLEIHRTATIEEIKNQYRTLAKQFHPDRNPGNKLAEELFKKISEAYECLSNPTSRAIHDQMLNKIRELHQRAIAKAYQQQRARQYWRNALLLSLALQAFSRPQKTKRRRRRW